jgi:iron complex outermembrane receptor protein
MYRNLPILRNGDGGSVSGNSLTGRSLRNQHDVVNDFDFERASRF